MAALKQGRYKPLDNWKQALLLFAVALGYADDLTLDTVADFEQDLFPFFEENYPLLTDTLKTGNKASEQTLADIRQALSEFIKRY